MEFDALLPSRLQFAFTIGLASFLAVLEGLWLISGRALFKSLYQFWLKIFALGFGMGVVASVALSQALGVVVFQACFLGVALLGWRRVGPWLHFAATVMLACGALFSALWLISADGGAPHAADWAAAPTFPTRLAHMVLAAYLATALVVGSAGAWILLKDPRQAESKVALRMAIAMFAIVAPLQVAVGHQSDALLRRHQPLKLAAIASDWKAPPAPAQSQIGRLGGRDATTRLERALPGAGALIHGLPRQAVIGGLDQRPRADWPVVSLICWAFGIMVGLGLAMIGLGLWGVWLVSRGGGPERSRLFLWSAVAMGPTGFAAVICGWIVAEVGRRPWAILGPPHAEAVSPVVFLAVYAVVLAAGTLSVLRRIAAGPFAEGDPPPPPIPPPPPAPAWRRLAWFLGLALATGLGVGLAAYGLRRLLF